LTADLLPIGAVADAAVTTVKTVRYYDEIGLITSVARVGDKRRFDVDTVRRVIFIRRAQEVGFNLAEIRSILDDNAGEWRDVLSEKLIELRTRRDHLDTIISALEEMQRCGCQAALGCVEDPGWTKA